MKKENLIKLIIVGSFFLFLNRATYVIYASSSRIGFRQYSSFLQSSHLFVVEVLGWGFILYALVALYKMMKK